MIGFSKRIATRTGSEHEFKVSELFNLLALLQNTNVGHLTVQRPPREHALHDIGPDLGQSQTLGPHASSYPLGSEIVTYVSGGEDWLLGRTAPIDPDAAGHTAS